MKKEKIYINFPLMVHKGRRRRKRKGAHLEKNCFFILPDAHANDDDDVVWATLLPNVFFIFQLPSIPSSKSQYRKASLCEKQISSDDNNDAPAGICVVAVYRSFNNLQALELTQ